MTKHEKLAKLLDCNGRLHNRMLHYLENYHTARPGERYYWLDKADKVGRASAKLALKIRQFVELEYKQ